MLIACLSPPETNDYWATSLKQITSVRAQAEQRRDYEKENFTKGIAVKTRVLQEGSKRRIAHFGTCRDYAVHPVFMHEGRRQRWR
jgi:hypothetical protein